MARRIIAAAAAMLAALAIVALWIVYHDMAAPMGASRDDLTFHLALALAIGCTCGSAFLVALAIATKDR